MRRLILFRHAKSDWSSEGVEDKDRPLNGRGRRVAGPMGAWLVGRGYRPDIVLCSTAKRARSTWELARVALTPAPKAQYDDELYMASASILLDKVKGVPAETQSVMIVGHNPGLEDFVKLVAPRGDPEARRALAEKFPTAAIAVVDFPFDDWSLAKAGAGALDRFVTPKALGIGEA
ncbi:histidine phosphatase family protein [Methylopila sp. M107]|uniref:SixA phosphatase family protein n=1 Tax=Methylopila sp. M107 TaxID=1101190 RepID=UPI0003605DFA|nr:histidine phosphatase family protein [Methylopila sp. M107]